MLRKTACGLRYAVRNTLWFSVLLCESLCNQKFQELSQSFTEVLRVAQSCMEVGSDFSLRP